MPAKSGASTNAIAAKTTTWGTAVSGGANSRLQGFSISPKENNETLTPNAIGSGVDMIDDVDIGGAKPAVSLGNGNERFDGATQFLESLLLGSDTSIAQGSGAYAHSIVWNATRDAAFATVAFDGCTGSVLEYASCVPTKVSTSFKVGEYVKKTIELLADKEAYTGTTNTSVSLAAATAPTTKKAVFLVSDKFRINTQSGAALADGDTVLVDSVDIELAEDREHSLEAKGSAGNGVPIRTGNPPFKATVKVTFKRQLDFRFRLALDAGSEFKADLVLTSPYMAGGAIPYSLRYFFPRLKVVSDIDWSVNNPADNPVTVTFTALVASAIPSGMCSLYPHKVVINKDVAAYV